MFELVIDTRKISVRRREKLTEGSAGIRAAFEFSPEWEGLGKTAVFETDRRKIAVFIDDDTVTVPWEVCEQAGLDVIVGVFGTNSDGSVVIPTVYAKLDSVSVGASVSDADNAGEPTADALQQIMAAAERAENTADRIAAEAESGSFNGSDGFSPLVSVERDESAKCVTISVEDKDGVHSAAVYDGAKGDRGESADIRINGISIVSDGTADIPIAAVKTIGVVAVPDWSGIGVFDNGNIYTVHATLTDIQKRFDTVSYKVITPRNIDNAVKLAMCDGKGVAWTAEEQLAAQARLGIISSEGVGF